VTESRPSWAPAPVFGVVTIDNAQSGRIDGFDRVDWYPGVAGDDVHGSTLIVGQSDGVDRQGVSAPGNLGVDNDASGQCYGHGSGNTANSDRNQPIGRECRWPSGRRGVRDWSRRYMCHPTVPDRPRRYIFGQTGGSQHHKRDPNGVGEWSRRYTCGQRSDGKPRRLAIGYDGDQWSGLRKRPGSFELTPKKDMISEAGHEPDATARDPMIAGDPLSTRLPLDRPRRAVHLLSHFADFYIHS